MGISAGQFRKLALAFEGAEEKPHFDRASFRAEGKIFATLSEAEGRAMVRLTPEQQEVMTVAEPLIFEKIAGVWGERGATWLILAAADAAAARSALNAAYGNLAAAKSGSRRRRKVAAK